MWLECLRLSLLYTLLDGNRCGRLRALLACLAVKPSLSYGGMREERKEEKGGVGLGKE